MIKEGRPHSTATHNNPDVDVEEFVKIDCTLLRQAEVLRVCTCPEAPFQVISLAEGCVMLSAALPGKYVEC